ncbi:hypothetical protein [Streptomyces sp. NPDC006510]|uniref:hypothetical protein n=1 Tax=Streptomyces sp. NPDC006510 TaxID=3155600 RepID=UPI0033A8B897
MLAHPAPGWRRGAVRTGATVAQKAPASAQALLPVRRELAQGEAVRDRHLALLPRTQGPVDDGPAAPQGRTFVSITRSMQ